MTPALRKRAELSGWLIFVLSAGFYTWAGIRAGDLLSTLGGVFFLLACLVFLVAFLPDRARGRRADASISAAHPSPGTQRIQPTRPQSRSSQ